MNPLLRTAVVTAAWLLVQGCVGLFLLRPKGRPYKAFVVVIHIIVFIFIAAGWAYTVSALAAASGNHVGSWIAEIVMALGVVSQLAVGIILTAGRKVPAPGGFVLGHEIGAAVAALGSLSGIACLLIGV